MQNQLILGINNYLKTNLAQYLTAFRQMVEINSFTFNPEGINLLAKNTSELFTKLDFSSEFIQAEDPRFGKHLFLSRPGRGTNSIILVSHLDTVFSEEEEKRNEFFWRPEGERIYGPGTIDIKGGTIVIYMLLTALKELAPEQFEKVNWLVALNAAEEQSAADFPLLVKERIYGKALGGLVFEGDYKNSKGQFLLVTSRKGLATFKITVEGRGAHSGVHHEHGVSAIRQLAELVLLIEAQTNYDKGISFNVGTINGGEVFNRVPDLASAEVEVRAFCPKEFKRGIEFIKGLTLVPHLKNKIDGFVCKTTVNLLSEIPPWQENSKTNALFETWQKAGREIGIQISSQSRGGRSDGNFFCYDMPTLDGLGPVGNFAHCSYQSPDGTRQQEYVEKSSLVEKATLNALAILQLISEQS